MSRITKTIAENVAIKLLEKKYAKIEEIKEGLKVKFTEIYKKQLPKEVLELFYKKQGFFYQRTNFVLDGNGHSHNIIYTTEPLPYLSGAVSLDVEDSKIILDIMNNISNLESEYNKLKLEIETTLLNLRTYSKISSEFPEATPFLPNTTSTALSVNISDLRNKLKQ